MEFSRINENTVQCIITPEDLEEEGIRIEDFMEKKEEVMEFLHHVVEMATEEVDYHPIGMYTPMQITVSEDQTVTLILSENPEGAFEELLKTLTEKLGVKIPKHVLEEMGEAEPEERLHRLQEFTAHMKGLSGLLKQLHDSMFPDAAGDVEKGVDNIDAEVSQLWKAIQENRGKENRIENLADPKYHSDAKQDGTDSRRTRIGEESSEKELNLEQFAEKMKEKDHHKAQKSFGMDQLQNGTSVFVFYSMHDLIEFSSLLPSPIRCESSLYKNAQNDSYYLELRKGRESLEKYARLFVRAIEYGEYETATENALLYMHDSMECLIADHALNRLKKIGK